MGFPGVDWPSGNRTRPSPGSPRSAGHRSSPRGGADRWRARRTRGRQTGGARCCLSPRSSCCRSPGCGARSHRCPGRRRRWWPRSRATCPDGGSTRWDASSRCCATTPSDRKLAAQIAARHGRTAGHRALAGEQLRSRPFRGPAGRRADVAGQRRHRPPDPGRRRAGRRARQGKQRRPGVGPDRLHRPHLRQAAPRPVRRVPAVPPDAAEARPPLRGADAQRLRARQPARRDAVRLDDARRRHLLRDRRGRHRPRAPSPVAAGCSSSRPTTRRSAAAGRPTSSSP